MYDKKQHWTQYGANPHLQRNNLTKEFHCKTCDMSLGDNAGGAGSHCKATHGMRIDGYLIKKETPVIPVKVTPQVGMMDNNNPLSKLYIKSGPLKPIEHKIDLSDHGPPTAIQKFESKKRVWLTCKQGEREGMPDELLKPLYEELGIQNHYEQKQQKEMIELEKRKKEKEERMKKREWIDTFYMYCYLNAKDEESANKIFNAYIMRLLSLSKSV